MCCSARGYRHPAFAGPGERVSLKDFLAHPHIAVQPSVSTPSRVDAALYYRFSDNFDAQLNLENLLGEDYFQYAGSNNNISPDALLTVKAGLNVKF